MDIETGWIKLHRQIQESEFYFAEKFNKTHAWIDLLLLATHKPQTIFVRGILIKLEPGDLFWSQESLADRWKWNRKTVNKFMISLESNGQIKRKVVNRIGITSIANWDIYQGVVYDKRDDKVYDKRDTNKNVKNVKNNAKALGDETPKTQQKEYGNKIIGKFREVLKGNLGVNPTGKSDKKEREQYWNAVTHLGVTRGMKDLDPKDIPSNVRGNMNHFIEWLKKDMEEKNYTIQNADTVRIKAKFFRENVSTLSLK